MRKLLSPSGAAVPASPALPDAEGRLNRFLRHTEIYRCLLLSVLSLALGLAFGRWLLPLLSGEEVTALLEAHCPPGISPWVLAVRLWAERLPVLLLLGTAGFTRFSGGLTSALVGARALSEGFVLWLLLAIRRGGMGSLCPLGVSPERWITAYLLWSLLDLAAVLLAATEARRLARGAPWPERIRLRADPALRARLLRYATFFGVALCLAAAGCGLYTAILYG